MEEKERFELFGEHCIKDNNPDARPQLLDVYVACVILNEQDKKIKAKEKEANTYAKEIVFLDNKIKQLKQSQNQVSISKLEMLHDMFCSTINNRILQNYVCSIIRREIEELKIDGEL